MTDRQDLWTRFIRGEDGDNFDRQCIYEGERLVNLMQEALSCDAPEANRVAAILYSNRRALDVLLSEDADKVTVQELADVATARGMRFEVRLVPIPDGERE